MSFWLWIPLDLLHRTDQLQMPERRASVLLAQQLLDIERTRIRSLQAENADPQFMRKNFMISLDNITSGRLHVLITSAFSHIDVGHIVSNMIGLYFFGMNIGRAFGPEFLLKLYLAGALGGSIFFLAHKAFIASSSKGQHLWNLDPSKTPGLGASGAVNAIMLLDIFLFPKSTLYFEFIIPVPAILLGIFLIGKDILRIIEGDSHISGAAHLGGAAVAAITWARIRKGRF